MKLEHVAVALGVVGAGLLIAFDDTLTRILGVAGLLGFVAVGLIAVANPGYLGQDGDQERDDAQGHL